MGYKRILTISEDDTREAEVSEPAWEHLKGEVGQAVLSLCVVQPIEIDELDRIEQNERYRRAMDAYTSKTLATRGNHHGAVRLAGREYSTWLRLYLFSGGILQPLHEVSDADLDAVEQLLADERSQRQRRRAAHNDQA